MRPLVSYLARIWNGCKIVLPPHSRLPTRSVYVSYTQARGLSRTTQASCIVRLVYEVAVLRVLAKMQPFLTSYNADDDRCVGALLLSTILYKRSLDLRHQREFVQILGVWVLPKAPSALPIGRARYRDASFEALDETTHVTCIFDARISVSRFLAILQDHGFVSFRIQARDGTCI